MFKLKQLAGHWKFFRNIQNTLTPKASGSVVGAAVFLQNNNDDHLHYFEEGLFTLVSGAQIIIKQEYFYIFDNAAQTIIKHEAQSGVPSKALYTIKDNKANHLCGSDLYIAHYEFSSTTHNEFTVKYKVNGPCKEYSSCTKYIKIA